MLGLSKGPNIGSTIPDFEIPSTSGAPFKMSDFRGRKIVLYFYPKDATPGCTIEGHEFTKLLGDFHAHNADVLGVSRDSMQSHDKFKAAENFQVDLLSDEQEQVCKIFDVIKEKNMYGNISMGIERSTFLIDENGKLVAEWRKVKVDGHAQTVLEKVKSLPS
jgi:peroxiredoxin Q/BCP